MKAIIKWTLFQRRLSIFWWSVAVFALIFINMIFYPSFKDQAEQLQKGFENIPDSTLQFVGGSADFFSPVGFLNSQIYFMMLPMLVSILAISLGGSLMAREEQGKTLDDLLARPISRSKLLLGKGLAGAIVLITVSLVGFITVLATSMWVNLGVSWINIALASFVCTLMALCFGAVTYAFTATGRARSASIGLGAFFALGGYIVVSLSGTIDWLTTPSKIFPFHYYQPESILRGQFDWSNVLYFVVVIAVSCAVSWRMFNNRDIE